MSLFIIIFLAFAAVIAFYIGKFPAHYLVTRSITVNRPPQDCFDVVINLRSWPNWSPWLIHEPDCPITYSDDPAAVGGYYDWNGKRVGAGRVTHQHAEAPAELEQTIQFLRPFKSCARIFWRFESDGDATHIHWTMDGKMPFLMRWMTPKMDSFVGPDYELGLVLLRGRLDDSADKPSIAFGDIVHRAPVACLTAAASGNLPAIRNAMQDGFSELIAAATPRAAGETLTMYHQMKGDGEWFAIDMAVTLGNGSGGNDGGTTTTAVPYVEKTLAGGAYLPVTLRGDYQYLKHAWRMAFTHAQQMRKLRVDKKRPPFEVYQNNPQTTAAADLVTVIHIPVIVHSAVT